MEGKNKKDMLVVGYTIKEDKVKLKMNQNATGRYKLKDDDTVFEILPDNKSKDDKNKDKEGMVEIQTIGLDESMWDHGNGWNEIIIDDTTSQTS